MSSLVQRDPTFLETIEIGKSGQKGVITTIEIPPDTYICVYAGDRHHKTDTPHNCVEYEDCDSHLLHMLNEYVAKGKGCYIYWISKTEIPPDTNICVYAGDRHHKTDTPHNCVEYRHETG